MLQGDIRVLGDTHDLFDEIATDRRNRTVNSHGMIYGSPELADDVPIIDLVFSGGGWSARQRAALLRLA
jgi:hypothetical protein